MTPIRLEQAYTGVEETRQIVDEVVDAAFNSVCSTMGPNAKFALVIEINEPIVLRDGVKVTKALDFNEIRRNSVAKTITSAALRTDEQVGDGTTTTVFMVHELYTRFKDRIDFQTVKVLDALVAETKKILLEQVEEVTPKSDKFKRMVYTTTNYQKSIADTVIDLIGRYKTPRFTLKKGNGHVEDYITINDGIVFNGRYVDPLKPQTRNHAFYGEANVLIIDGPVNTLNPQLLTYISTAIAKSVDAASKAAKPVVVIARHFENGPLNEIIAINNGLQKRLDVSTMIPCIIPYVLDAAGTSGSNIFKDLGRLLDVPVYPSVPTPSKEEPLLEKPVVVDLDMFGVKFDTTDAVTQQRVTAILNELEPMYDGMTITQRASVIGKLLENRIGRLRAENIEILVSGMTEAEITERFYLYEDACRAAETSLRFGVMPGIGYGYNTAALQIEQAYRKWVNVAGKDNRQCERCLGDNPVGEGIEYLFGIQCPSISHKKLDFIVTQFIQALTAQYRFLTGLDFNFEGDNVYPDLASGKEDTNIPSTVFDNGCASICAIEASWSVVRRLGNLSVIMGKSNHSYGIG